MPDTLTGKVAIVTGAGRGLGAAVAKLLAAEGAAIVANDLGVELDGSAPSHAPADRVVADITSAGGKAVASYDDVTRFGAGSALVQQSIEAFGGLDIVVTCQAIIRPNPIDQLTDDEWDSVIAVDLTGTFNVVRHAATHMRQQRSGRIITVSSTSGLVGQADQANYGAAKSGVGGLTKVVARDLGRYGITCNAIVAEASSDMPSPGVEGNPNDVAPFVGYLASDFAANVNGQFFYVNGQSVGLMSQPRLEASIVRTEGFFSVDELRELMPQRVTNGVSNPAPARSNNG